MLPTGNQDRELMAKIPVNGKVLEWARRLRGLTLTEAAALLHISAHDLEEYESGAKEPLVSLLRDMAAKYRINFSSLLMPQPLPLKPKPTDFRTRRGSRRLSMETLVAREEIQEALEVFRDIRSETRGLIPKLDIGKARLTENPEDVAARERKRFRITLQDQRHWKGLGAARSRWREEVENHGVFTYMLPMPPEELSGFSLFHEGMAAICVNDREVNDGAKIFTLFHEYCHLLLRKTGISDENSQNRIEKFCNRFAASFLIPKPALVESVDGVQSPYEFSDTEVRRLATRFRVSNRAMAFRLEETGLAPEGFYHLRTHPWDLPNERPITSDQQPSPVRILVKKKGRLHMNTILQATHRRIINSFDASELIGLQASVFPKIEAYLDR